jgi:DNA-binding transcriptional MerR regulator
MAMTEPTMTIGELAASARVNIETIRYYEREGILPEPPRTASGYRQYSDADRWRLAFIRRGKALGFTLKEIAELLGAGEQRSVDEVVNLAEKRLALVERDIEALTARRDQLHRLIETCATGSGDDCLELAP